MPTRFSWKSARLEVAFNSEEHRTVSGHRREPSGTFNWSFFIGLKQRQSRGKKPNPGFGKPPPTLALAGCLFHHTSCHLIQRPACGISNICFRAIRTLMREGFGRREMPNCHLKPSPIIQSIFGLPERQSGREKIQLPLAPPTSLERHVDIEHGLASAQSHTPKTASPIRHRPNGPLFPVDAVHIPSDPPAKLSRADREKVLSVASACGTSDQLSTGGGLPLASLFFIFRSWRWFENIGCHQER